jgi:hypothetical protein
MNNKITNPLLKQLISEIAGKATEGRTNLNWKSLNESKNILKKEAEEKKKEDDVDALLGGGGGEADAAQETPQASAEAPAKNAAAPAADASAGGGDLDAALGGGGDAGAEEDPEKAQADAAKAKAELEKAKAEKAQAEEELEQHSYIKLKSSGGTKYLLGKILGSAFKTNTIDALASEMAQKLKITTPNDAAAFEKDMALYKNIPGMVELIKSIKGVAVEQPKETSDEEPTA